MDELIVVITVKYYDRLGDTQEYATALSIPNAVYLALLTGGESAIKSFYKSNGPYSDDETLLSAKMSVARIEERGRTLQIKTAAGSINTYSISSGRVIDHFSYKSRDERRFVDSVCKQPKDLVKISYRSGTSTNEAIFAEHDDGTYSEVGDYPTKW